MIRWLFLALGLIVLIVYARAEWYGMTLHQSQRQYIPHGLRSAAHGGYRSYWTSGFHGGK